MYAVILVAMHTSSCFLVFLSSSLSAVMHKHYSVSRVVCRGGGVAAVAVDVVIGCYSCSTRVAVAAAPVCVADYVRTLCCVFTVCNPSTVLLRNGAPLPHGE